MFLSTFERRRIVIAALLTVLVLPFVLLNRTDDKVADSAEVATTTTQLEQADDDGSLEPIILGGPSPIVQDGSAQIAYPASSLTGVQAIASFSNFDNAPEIVCYMPHSPSDTNTHHPKTPTPRQDLIPCRAKYKTSH